jgi:hypothetical protein
LQHPANLVNRHIKIPEPPDRLRGRHLARREGAGEGKRALFSHTVDDRPDLAL